MTSHIARAVPWAAFAIIILTIWLTLLYACDLGVTPLFGLRYCRVPQASLPANLLRERERERDLRRRLHEAGLHMAGLPRCKTQVTPQPAIQTPAKEEVQPAKDERRALTLPKKSEDLEGCWQSDNGDANVYRDTVASEFMGKRRTCLCFDLMGRGRLLMLYSTGARCTGSLNARIEADRFSIHFPEVPCTDRSVFVQTDIYCSENGQGAVSCEWHSRGKFPKTYLGEGYHRVDASFCEGL